MAVIIVGLVIAYATQSDLLFGICAVGLAVFAFSAIADR